MTTLEDFMEFSYDTKELEGIITCRGPKITWETGIVARMVKKDGIEKTIDYFCQLDLLSRQYVSKVVHMIAELPGLHTVPTIVHDGVKLKEADYVQL